MRINLYILGEMVEGCPHGKGTLFLPDALFLPNGNKYEG